MTTRERELALLLAEGPDGCAEVRVQMDFASVVAECDCGCPSIALSTSAPAVPQAITNVREPLGNDDYFAIVASGPNAEGHKVEVILHVAEGHVAELEIWAGGTEGVSPQTFGRIYLTLHERAHRRDLATAAELIATGMGDDGFSDFRDWLISHGRAVYERALADPDSIADLVEKRSSVTAELLHGVMYDAYEQSVGEELPEFDIPGASLYPSGPHWITDDELATHLPRCWEIFQR